jgi:hypothetical protein
MVEVNPKLTTAKLKKSARTTSEGKGVVPLPGIKTDAKQAVTADPTDPNSPFYGAINCDPKGYGKNRELADRISKAVRDLKASDDLGPRFVLAWRLYPNDEHPCWHQKDAHFCGCGCGCFARGTPSGVRKIKRTRKVKQRK